MADIIRLLPESVSNQIAAGEVVQRPASAVKELLENAVDSGSTVIKLIIREAGKNLIRVTDNGCGMSDQDARMCFERHATSKIKTADDLLSIRTLGFRGEALASIASIAQVEMKTRKTGEEVGTEVCINGSEFVSQKPVNCPEGTDISVKNLFYNVPARRNFLKSNTLEFKYVLEEFFRVALVNPDIHFTFYNNDKILHQLNPSNLKQRIVSLFGNHYNERMIPVAQETGLVNVTGFIGKPEFAKKTRGEQYFFTNGRYIRNPYLSHAVENAYNELIPGDSFPTYFIYLEVDPQMIDINIHPTKTEINFQDARSIYAILNSAVKQSIGRFNLSPTLDFEKDKSFDLPPLPEGKTVNPPVITVNPEYNPFGKQAHSQPEFPFRGQRGGEAGWMKLMDPLKSFKPSDERLPLSEEPLSQEQPFCQLMNRFIATQTADGIVLVDQQAARERILYERFLRTAENRETTAQRLLIPVTINVSPDDVPLMEDLSGTFTGAGLEVNSFGQNAFLVHTVPAGLAEQDITGLVEKILEECKKDTGRFLQEPDQRLARTLAVHAAARMSPLMRSTEMHALWNELMSCRSPESSPDGRPVLMLLSREELAKKFKTELKP